MVSRPALTPAQERGDNNLPSGSTIDENRKRATEATSFVVPAFGFGWWVNSQIQQPGYSAVAGLLFLKLTHSPVFPRLAEYKSA